MSQSDTATPLSAAELDWIERSVEQEYACKCDSSHDAMPMSISALSLRRLVAMARRAEGLERLLARIDAESHHADKCARRYGPSKDCDCWKREARALAPAQEGT